MADNYLERKMEDMRRMPQTPFKPPRTGAKSPRLSPRKDERRIFVTGGAHGIGRAVVAAFRNIGCRVAFCDSDAKLGYAVSQELGARFYPLDVTDADALEQCLDSVAELWGDIDVVVNNVGVSNFKPLAESEISDFETILNTNLRPVFITSRHFARRRTQRAYGRIINIASTRHLMSEPGCEGYAASKGAIVSLTHALMMSLAPLGITVNCVSPGWIECYDRQAIRPVDSEFHPSGRVGEPADIARVVLFLADEKSDFINGENITVDGGVTRKMIYPPED